MTPPFRPRFPWWGGDLQTLRNRCAYRHRPLPGKMQAVRVDLADGDALTGTLHQAPDARATPLVLLLHGLTGSENSMYMLESAHHHLTQGRNVLRMNLRAAGSSLPLCKTAYSGDSWPDIEAVLDALDAEVTKNGVFLIGYSMGGNILLNGLPHIQDRPEVIGAASVSAPIDPAGASQRLMERRNRIYEKSLLKDMQKSHLELPFAQHPDIQTAIKSTVSIWNFDDMVTAPRLGFGSAREYYEGTAGKNQIHAVQIPLLLIHAKDDPWIPVAPYLALSPPPNVTVEITQSGGHVGYHGKDSPQPWYDLRISNFIDGLARAARE